MRLLVTGVSGLLGLNLAHEATAHHEVIGTHRGQLPSAPFASFAADLTQPDAPERLLDLASPDWVVNCAALADVDRCESDPESAYDLNSRFPGRLAGECRSRQIGLVHISTDAVFDGTKASAYAEDDTPNPRGVYGRSKLDGELAVLGVYPDAIVARVNFFGWSLSGKRSLAEFFFTNLGAGRQVKGFTDVIFCPMLANHLGRILLGMLERGLTGLFHVVGPQPMSKFEFGRQIARRFGLDPALISPSSVRESGLAAQRSLNLSLSIHKISTAVPAEIPAFSTGLAEFYQQHAQGYPQLLRGYAQAPA